MTENHPPTESPDDETRPRGMAVAAFALSLVPPLAPVGLIVGIIALVRGAPRKWFAIASVGIAPLNTMCCLGVFVYLPALGKERIARMRFKSSEQLRLIGQGLMIYASGNRDWYPEAGADWEQRLIDAGLIPPEFLVSPGAEPGQQSYFYIPGHRFPGAGVPLVYENAELWNGRGGHVYFDDGRVEWVKRDDYVALFERLEAERRIAESGAPPDEPPAGGSFPASGPPAVPADAVNIVSRGMELAEAPAHQALQARTTRARPSIAVGPMETIIEWRMLLINQTSQQIDGLALSVEGTARSQTINAIPPQDPLLPRAPLEVILPVKMPPGAMPASLHLRAEVIGVRFADGSTLGDTSALPAPGPPQRTGRDRPPARAERDAQAPQVLAFAEPLFVRRADVTVMEATYGAGETWGDVRPAIEAWMAEDDWPTPLRVRPSQLGVADPAAGVQKTLRIRFEAAGSITSAEAVDGDWILIGGPGSLGLGPVASDAPLELEDMRIVAAWFGHMGRWVNVLPALRERVDDSGRIDTRASTGLAGMDPAEGVRKSLMLYFERDGAMWQASYPEDSPVRLPLER